MIRMAAQLALAPALVGASTLACRRWGERIGGLLGAFPVVVGPLLLITAQQRGAAFAAQTAAGTLLGLVGLAGFVFAYGRKRSLRPGGTTSIRAPCSRDLRTCRSWCHSPTSPRARYIARSR